MTAEQITSAIAAGHLDGHLAEINAAIRSRLLEDDVPGERWRVTYGDLVVTQDDITLAEAATIERIAGVTWGEISPVDSAVHTHAVIAAGLHHRTGLDLAAALSGTGTATVDQAVEAIDFYQVT